ncbi:hypothetical protein NE237_006186 [Protea cynaroides]|uniref:H15 domain-containing protein n=1 Tax=Protea cynaroides TaxID=273540 RepID=A0A9Q0KLW5_9MAGN|nr:hypothetical protein NE237_006186 [Protea cynaroides]
MEFSIVPLGSTEASPLPNNMNSSAAPPPPTAQAEESLISRLDSSIVLIPSTDAPAILADAVPPTHGSNPHHPPYAEMIITAIRVLGDKKGSSKKAIKKYIDATYSNLPVSHAALLSNHLKRLKNRGVVIMVKHSYKLPKNVKAPIQLSSLTKSAVAAPPSSLSVPVKRGRGRPPKLKSLDIVSIGSDAQVLQQKRASDAQVLQQKRFSDAQVLQQKRGRGRPPKSKPILLLSSNGFIAPPKPRRQPKKPRPITITPSYGLVAPPKQPRKPPKPRVFVASAGKSSVTRPPRPRDRPRKNAAPSSSAEVGGRPRKNAALSSSAEVGSPGLVNKGSRPRGRPPKVPKNVDGGAVVVVLPHVPVSDGSGGGLSNVMASEKRGRGRPRKDTGPPTSKRSVGRGRPKKVTLNPTMATATAAMG